MCFNYCFRSVISDEENAFAMEENHQIIKSLQEEISQKNDAYEKLYEEHKQLEQVNIRRMDLILFSFQKINQKYFLFRNSTKKKMN